MSTVIHCKAERRRREAFPRYYISIDPGREYCGMAVWMCVDLPSEGWRLVTPQPQPVSDATRARIKTAFESHYDAYPHPPAPTPVTDATQFVYDILDPYDTPVKGDETEYIERPLKRSDLEPEPKRGGGYLLRAIKRECRAGDLRVGQLVSSAAQAAGIGEDPFYLYDKTLEEYCDQLHWERFDSR